MIISDAFLSKEYSRRFGLYGSEQRITEALNFSTRDRFDLFISHSYLNRNQVATLVELFKEAGYSVYVDWINDNNSLNRNYVTTDTALKIRKRVTQCNGMAYVATSEASNSKWCPWELGLGDGLLNHKVCILPILRIETNHFKGQEYLGLYNYIEYDKRESDGKGDFWIHDQQDSQKYIHLREWLSSGRVPYLHAVKSRLYG